MICNLINIWIKTTNIKRFFSWCTQSKICSAIIENNYK